MKRLCAIIAIILLFSNIQAQTGDSSSNRLSQDTTTTIAKPASEEETGFVAKVGSWYTNHLSYWSVTLLMGLESSFIPFPSEIVVPPAAYAACNPESPLHETDSNFLNIALVVLFATIGAILGALINYFISYFLGRPFVYWFADTKFAHLCMIDRSKVERAEKYFIDHGNASTLIGRLVPVIRQLISIPAGLAKMRLLPFVGYTTLGALAWNIILAALGYVAHGQQDLIAQYSTELSWILLGLGALFIIYLVISSIRKKKRRAQNEEKA